MLGGLLVSMLLGGGAGFANGLFKRKDEKALKNKQANQATEDFQALLEERQAQALYNGVKIDEGSPLALLKSTKQQGMSEIDYFRKSGLTNPLTSLIRGMFGGFSTANKDNKAIEALLASLNK